MKQQLPAKPDLDQLKHQAKDLLKAYKSNAPEAIQRFRESHPRWEQPSKSPEVEQSEDISLSDAQLVIAREYGFASWPKLKTHVDSILLESGDPLKLLQRAFHDDDAPLFRKLIERYPQFKSKLNDPIPESFDSPPITHVRSPEMLDVFLEAGADINAKSRWWAGGFGLLHCASPELAHYAISRGAKVDIHAAARLGLIDRVRELVTAQPDLVHARGGDGQTPLHFASTVEIAAFLVDHGADMEVRDIDHESTPAQYMVKNRQEILRFLVQRGCKTDILMAAALGDMALARQHLERNPNSIRTRVSNEYFPMVGGKTGGTIYQWELGWYVSAHQVAKTFGHQELFHYLLDQSPAEVKLVTAGWLGDEQLLKAVLAEHPGVVGRLLEEDRRQIAHAARNNDTMAVRLMLEAGWPVTGYSQHHATALHWAAWLGNATAVELLLRKNPPLEDTTNDYQGTPLGWAIHGSQNSWHRTGDHVTAVKLLLDAGVAPPKELSGTEAVKEVLRKAGVK